MADSHEAPVERSTAVDKQSVSKRDEANGITSNNQLLETAIAYYQDPKDGIQQTPGFEVLSVRRANEDGKEEQELLSKIYHSTTVPGNATDNLNLSKLPNYLVSTSSSHRHIDVLISTLSGAGQALKVNETILLPFLNHLSISYETHTTTSASSITELTASLFRPRALNNEAQTIILLSGDGGVVDILNGLFEPPPAASTVFARPTLLTLPLGTANALFHSLQSSPPDPLPHALRTLFHGQPTQLPTFTAGFSPDSYYVTGEKVSSNTVHGAVVCSWALHASLVADSDTPEYRKHGAARFQMAAKENLFPEPHAYRGRVTLFVAKSDAPDGGVKEKVLERDSFAYLLVTMVSRLESGFIISPASKPTDQNLRALWFGKPEVESGDDIMKLLTEAYQNGKHVERKGVGYQIVKGLRIEMEEEDERFRRICVDGRIVVVAKGGWVEVWDGLDREQNGGIDIVI